MFDVSPEKLMVLLLFAVVILGPNRLPAAARTLASGLVRARRLAHTLTQPVHDTLQEPRRILNDTLADLRTAVQPVPTSSPAASPDPIELPADPDLN
jgi:Sec-independent protein translocase protein TatA